MSLFLRGDDVLGSGWISRADRLLHDQPEGIEHGSLLYLTQVEAGLEGADLDDVVRGAQQVQDIGRRHHDPNLVAAGVVCEGRALLKQGNVSRGRALLDEAMLTVLSDALSPEWAGNVYCHLMAACHEVGDLRRAMEWTEATSRWLATLPAAVLFTGICRVHRSQVLQVTGSWDEAEHEAMRVCDDLADIPVAAAAEGHYQVGEMRRLRGDLAGAKVAYERARECGRDPQPGLSLLYLAEGRPTAALASARAALTADPSDRLARARLCGAAVEIAVVCEDMDVARRACQELEATASQYGSSGLEAAALEARGAVALAEGRYGEALASLRAACRRWQEVHASYDAARVGVMLARAYTALGDPDAAAAELGTAEEAFLRLGASVDAAQAAALRARRTLPDGLTEREVQVLDLVAAGKTNRQVAETLVLSDKTIARHLSNIFRKIDVSTRSEAAAYAFEHGLTSSTRG